MKFKPTGLLVFCLSIASFGHCLDNRNELPADKITLIAAGDLMMSRYIGKVIKRETTRYPLGKVSGLFKQYDLVYCNLESILGTKTNSLAYPDKPYNFLASTNTINVLRSAGINVVSLANNHAMDYGFSAVRETKALLDEYKIGYFGVGSDLEQARRAYIAEIKGFKVAFLGYGIAHSADYYAGEGKPGIAPVKTNEIIKDIKALKGKVDYIIVSLHWGEEYTHYPGKGQKRIAHRIIDSGADIILGHHPHVLQGIELYKDKLIVYSLGNLLFDQKKHDTKYGMLIAFTLYKNGGIQSKLIPLDRFETYFPKVAEGDKREAIYKMIDKYSSGFSVNKSTLTKAIVKERI